MNGETTRGRARALAVAALLLAVAAPSPALDWPRYRGPGQDGRSGESGLLAAWPERGPAELWRFRLGDGFSGISVVAGRAYTLFGAGDDEVLLAVDAETGRELWRRRTDANRPDGQGDGPRSTPTVDEGRVFALSARGKLWAVDAASGEPSWTVDLVERFGARTPRWGVSTSPLVEGDLLLVDAGGGNGRSLLALDKSTGELRWSAQSDDAGYSTPLAVTVGGVRQVLFFTGNSLMSVSPRDGKLYWRFPWKTSFDVNAAMPVFLEPDRVFVSSGYDKGAALLRIVAAGERFEVEEIWRSRDMQNHFNSSVLVDGHLYGFHNAMLRCIVAASGEERWTQRGFGRGSLMYVDGDLLVLGDRGLLARVEATPEEYREKDRTQVFNARTWTMPTLSGGRLFLRSEGEMVALDLRAPR